MDKTPLVGPDFDGGRDLLEALERAGLPIAVAAWLNLREAFDWQLYLASPDVQTYGPTTVIRFVDKILIATQSPIPLRVITIVNTSNNFVNKIPEYYDPSKNINLVNNTTRVIGMPFDDGYIVEGFIYKIDKGVKPSKVTPKPDASALKRAKSLAA
ncbi:hypothetical protein RB623_04535 [Mesorhizobium sp. LHD-90]|uniref:hypothetical protein n=1 Tax=Mesorhizobium sp. LHD-90 TaxID=3071414 RepID=UPI0027DF79E2|nr:hypothetical protein [Mesorhizobium sp. LHD-90]MDQ6433314.1 hypothetical protein [Mesorhizobium sp. LHD-90]